ncbi:MAG TPA: hypothetical protein VF572_03400 [Candidatus Saccharimonadales bacterium]|jgi:hypothetical protein
MRKIPELATIAGTDVERTSSIFDKQLLGIEPLEIEEAVVSGEIVEFFDGDLVPARKTRAAKWFAESQATRGDEWLDFDPSVPVEGCQCDLPGHKATGRIQETQSDPDNILMVVNTTFPLVEIGKRGSVNPFEKDAPLTPAGVRVTYDVYNNSAGIEELTVQRYRMWAIVPKEGGIETVRPTLASAIGIAGCDELTIDFDGIPIIESVEAPNTGQYL